APSSDHNSPYAAVTAVGWEEMPPGGAQLPVRPRNHARDGRNAAWRGTTSDTRNHARDGRNAACRGHLPSPRRWHSPALTSPAAGDGRGCDENVPVARLRAAQGNETGAGRRKRSPRPPDPLERNESHLRPNPPSLRRSRSAPSSGTSRRDPRALRSGELM